MENNKQLSKTGETRLETYSQKSLVIREQPDKTATIAQIADILLQLSKLYQIPNFTGENAVLLSKWIITNYSYEPLETVIDCLINPPHTGDKNWRLTPDTIQQWLTIRLEEQAEKREKEYQKEKAKLKEIEAVPNIPNFDELFKGTWYEDVKKQKQFDQEMYEQIKKERLERLQATRVDDTDMGEGTDNRGTMDTKTE